MAGEEAVKRAFFVLGAEGSGTRMLAQSFIAAGCRGSAEHQQPLDSLDFAGDGDLVFRRSMPHGGKWPDLRLINKRMWVAGYMPVPVLILRKSDYLVAHQLRTDREHDGVLQAPYASSEEEVRTNLRRATEMVYDLAWDSDRHPVVVHYELWTESELYRDSIFCAWGLGSPDGAFFNANEHPRYAAVTALAW